MFRYSARFTGISSPLNEIFCRFIRLLLYLTIAPERSKIQNPESKIGQIQNRLLFACLLLAVAMLSLSVPLHCVSKAATVGGFSLLDGALFGLALAAVTRTRRVGWIYFFLLCAVFTLAPLFLNWPPADADDLMLWRGAPALFNNYFDALRPALFLLALPYPFARFGYHGPDLISP